MNALLISLKITFLYLFVKELIALRFKKKSEKRIWFLIALIFGYCGYCIFLVFRRRLIIKRTFHPKFNPRNNQSIALNP